MEEPLYFHTSKVPGLPSHCASCLVVQTIYSVKTDKLQAWHSRSIMGITWRNKINNDKVIKKTGLPSLKSILIHIYLWWLGHLKRVDHKRLFRQILYSNFEEGKRDQESPRLRHEKEDIDNSTWQKRQEVETLERVWSDINKESLTKRRTAEDPKQKWQCGPSTLPYIQSDRKHKVCTKRHN